MIKKLIVGLILVVAGLFIYAAIAPSEFKIERSLEMAATPAQIYPHLANTKLANAWNPFLAADPEAQITYEGVEAGVGAKTSWASKKIGEGSATIIETIPNQKVKVRLDFVKPFVGSNIAEYSLLPIDARTKVTWAMTGHLNYFQRLVTIFLNPDKAVGAEFEKGLKSLKDRVSTTAAL